MGDYATLLKIIADHFREYKAYDLPDVCKKYGIECDSNLDPMASKRLYLESGLKKKTFVDLSMIAKQVIADGCNSDFTKSVEPFLNDDFFAVPMLTRRALLNWLSSQSDLEGNCDMCAFVSKIWDIDKMSIPRMGETIPLRDYIFQHMVRNDDITYQELLENLLDFMYISDRQMTKLLETLVDPHVRDGDSQEYYVHGINSIVSQNGIQLIARNNIAGIPIYKVESIARGIDSPIHNIVFACYDGKPDIVIDDSLSNTLKIASNADKCLFYDLPISHEGLSWDDLVSWWNDNSPEYDIEVEKSFVERLRLSLDSEPEVKLLRTYYNYLYKLKNKNLPALIPQVYCHYDPKSANMRNGQVYVHQRMDFLLLFPHGVRVIIEIDGKQHYSYYDNPSNANIASPVKYAAMVRDDRDLKLYGYDVYRFGGQEFTVSDQNLTHMLEDFFMKLFKKYNLL